MSTIVSQPKILQVRTVGETTVLAVTQPTVATIVPGQGQNGADGQSFVPRGPWSDSESYAIGDVVSFGGGNYILYAEPATGDDPTVDTAHWDTFGSGSGVAPSRSISTTAPLTGGGDLSADRTLGLVIGAGLDVVGGELVATGGGGGGLPDQTGQGGAVLGTDGTDAAWVRTIASEDNGSTVEVSDGFAAVTATGGGVGASASADAATGAALYANDGTHSASVAAKPDGTVEVTATGAVTITAADGVEVVGADASTKAEPGVVTVAVADDADYVAPRPQETVRSRGTGTSPTAVVDGDVLAYTLDALGYDGAGYVAAAEVKAVVDGTVDTDIVPAAIVVRTADATGALTERIRHGADGTTDITGSLTVNGSPVSGGSGIPDTIVDAKGDLIVATAADTVARLAVSGTNGRVLTEDSGETTGVKWGPGPGLVKIASGTFSASSGVSLPSGVFDGTYDDYCLAIRLTSSASVETRIRMRASGTDDSSSVYSQVVRMRGTDAAEYAVGARAQSSWIINNPQTGFGSTRHDIIGPALAEQTIIMGEGLRYIPAGGGGVSAGHSGGAFHATTTFDSLTFYPGSGTITGRWALYGYVK